MGNKVTVAPDFIHPSFLQSWQNTVSIDAVLEMLLCVVDTLSALTLYLCLQNFFFV